MSISPNALWRWAGLMGSLSKILYVQTRDGIALAVSQANGCDDCLAAHSYVSTNLAKPLRGEIALNRQGRSGNPKLRWCSRRPFHRGARLGVRRPVRHRVDPRGLTKEHVSVNVWLKDIAPSAGLRTLVWL
jgi:hypothetical protein